MAGNDPENAVKYARQNFKEFLQNKQREVEKAVILLIMGNAKEVSSASSLEKKWKVATEHFKKEYCSVHSKTSPRVVSSLTQRENTQIL